MRSTVGRERAKLLKKLGWDKVTVFSDGRMEDGRFHEEYLKSNGVELYMPMAHELIGELPANIKHYQLQIIKTWDNGYIVGYYSPSDCEDCLSWFGHNEYLAAPLSDLWIWCLEEGHLEVKNKNGL